MTVATGHQLLVGGGERHSHIVGGLSSPFMDSCKSF